MPQINMIEFTGEDDNKILVNLDQLQAVQTHGEQVFLIINGTPVPVIETYSDIRDWILARFGVNTIPEGAF